MVGTWSWNMALAVDLQVLRVIPVIVVGAQGETTPTYPAFEATFVEKGAVLQRSNFVVKIGWPFAAETRLLHLCE